MRFKFLLLLLFAFAINISRVSAQNISLENIQNFKVDQLSDEQVLQLYQKIQANGYSEDSAYQLMQQKGLPSIEIEKLKKRIALVKSGGKTSLSFDTKGKPDSISYSRQDVSTPQNIFNPIQSKIFGLSFFSNSLLSFQPNIRIATPQGYIIGPEDELIILLTGLNETSVKTRVTPEGRIQIPYVGLVAVNGLSIEQAKSQIKTRMQRVYPALASGQTELSITLGNIRSIRVTILGEVKQPGSYTISSLSTIFNALYQSGGPQDNGSLRKIELIRNNKLVKVIDFYPFLQKGLLIDNIRLQDQDVIRIPVYQKRVMMSGEIKKPGIYELLPTETLSDLIAYSGGFSDDAYQMSTKIFQKGNIELNVKDVPQSVYGNYVPNNADSVVFGQILNRYSNRVTISGAVFRPGVFELKEGLTLLKLINEASGLRDDALLSRGYINRIKPDLTKQTVSFDLNKVKAGFESDILLQREDEVVIFSSFEMSNASLVSITGNVKMPGNFTYREGMILEDLIAMSGGFEYNAAFNRIEISRIIKNTADSVANQLVQTFTVQLDSNLKSTGNSVVLQPMDKITVPQLVNYQVLGNISIGGEVLFPGVYALQRRDETALELLKRAGGISPSGSLINAQVYRNGLRVDADLAGSEKDSKLILLPQDSVFIPKENPFVEVIGGVNTPQLFRFKSKSFKYYINAAGGERQGVKIKNAYIAYANGINSPIRNFLFFRNYPSVSAGSQIIVPNPDLQVKVKLGVGEISAAATILTALVSLIAVLSR